MRRTGPDHIDEGAVAEFSLAIGVSTDSGRNYLGDAVELRYRLPRIWNRVTSGRLPVWKARKIAQATMSLPPEGASFVDRALYFVAHKCSYAEIDRQVDNTRTFLTPEHLKDWCEQAGTTVTIKPVIDLDEELRTEAYRPTAALQEQTRLRYPECPFPLCNRPSWRHGQNADHDHIEEYPEGPTASSNMAPQDLHRLDLPTGPRASAGSGPAHWATDISADPNPADHGRRGHTHATSSRVPVAPPAGTYGPAR